MIKVDLITGFLGAGKTALLKRYARYFMDKGQRIGILENDFGAVNVDMLMLQDLRGENCELEMVAGGCDEDCHRRRFKTKLISMAMSGYDRVIIEPSGLFDMDEFFDALREEPLDNWYTIGSVIAVLDVTTLDSLTPQEQYILDSQLGDAGCIFLSKLDAAEEDTEKAISKAGEFLEGCAERLKLKRSLRDMVLAKTYDALADEDMERLSSCGYKITYSVKKLSVHEAGFESLYFLEHGLDAAGAQRAADALFAPDFPGHVSRVKGFIPQGEGWIEMNAAPGRRTMAPVRAGQEVLIVIGRDMDPEAVKAVMKKENRTDT